MKKLATLAIAMALLFPRLASGEPDPSRTNLLDNGFEYTVRDNRSGDHLRGNIPQIVLAHGQ